MSTPEGAWGFARYAFEQIDSITVIGGGIAVRKRAPQDLDGAIAIFERELAKSNGNDALKERYAEYLIKKGVNLEHAEAMLREVLSARPKRLFAASLLTNALVSLKRLDEAANSAKRLVEIDAGQIRWWQLLADVERERNRSDLELLALKRAIELEPRPQIYDRIGAIHERLGDLTAALAAARIANELRPDNAYFRERMTRLERRM